MTPFRTTRANYGTTTAGLHAHQKSMRSFAPHNRGLEGPFHDLLREKLQKNQNPTL
jgi:hypothetical protein